MNPHRSILASMLPKKSHTLAPRPLHALLLILAASIFLSACTARPTATELVIAPETYVQTFDAARDVLRDRRFELERIDARSGVISTRPRTFAGGSRGEADPKSVDAKVQYG